MSAPAPSGASRIDRALIRVAAWVDQRFAWLGPYQVLVLSAVAGMVIVVPLGAASGEIYEAVHDSSGVASLDQPVLDAALRVRTPTLNQAVTLFTDLGGPVLMPVLTVLLLGILVWRWRSRTPVVLMVLAVLGSLGLTVLGKRLIARARPPFADAVPPYEQSASFPSGHTLNSTVIAGVFAYLALRRVTRDLQRVAVVVAACGWAGAMGLSRVYLGHHWLTDVLVAWTLGLALLGVIITAHRLFLALARQRAHPVT